MFNGSIPGLLLLCGEIAGRKFSVFPMISYALAAFALSGTAGISAVASFQISFYCAFHFRTLLRTSFILSNQKNLRPLIS
jgi:hypothetical protein